MVPLHSALLFTCLFVSFTTVAAQSGCFWANGTENPSLDYSPCEGSGLTTICCSIRDVCLDNGLCRANTGYYWRETCTSSDWDIGTCQDLCSYNATQKASDQIVTPCDGTANSTVWCCGDSDSCCGQDSTVPRYTIANKFAASVSATASSVISSIVPLSTATSTFFSTTSTPPETNSVTDSVTESSSPDSGLSTGAKAGIGVGAAVGALGLIGLGMFIARALQWRKKLRAKEEGTLPSHAPVAHGTPAFFQVEGTPVLELEHQVAEKPATERYGRRDDVQELPASGER